MPTVTRTDFGDAAAPCEVLWDKRQRGTEVPRVLHDIQSGVDLFDPFLGAF